MSLLGTFSLNERGLSHCHPMTMDELYALSLRADWGEPREDPGEELKLAAEASAERTRKLLAEFDPHS